MTIFTAMEQVPLFYKCFEITGLFLKMTLSLTFVFTRSYIGTSLVLEQPETNLHTHFTNYPLWFSRLVLRVKYLERK